MKIWIPKYGFHNYRKNELFLAPKIWTSHPSTVILFLLVDSCRKNKIRTNELVMHWKAASSEQRASAKIIWFLLKNKKVKLFWKTKRRLELDCLPYLLHDFWRKIVILFNSINWPNFIPWLPLLLEMW